MDVVTEPNSPTLSLAERWFGTRDALRRWSLGALIGNIGIIITGAVVRLTDSGLGCDTWPKCTDSSFTPRAAVNHHSLIEFGNRTLTFVLIALAIGTVLSAVRSHASASERRWAWYAAAGIPLQGVVGGISVLMKLNPWVVALHLLLSVWLVAVLTRLVMSTRGVVAENLPVGLRRLVQVLFWDLMLAIWLGTVVTGAGPNSGSFGTKRNHLDIESVARIHSLSVWLACALTLAVLWLTRRQGLQQAHRYARWLLAAIVLQGAIGYIQYFMGLPTGVVIVHMAGIGVVTVAATWLWNGTQATSAR